MPKRGPRTYSGKAIASTNATRHGIFARTPVIPGLESVREWNDHRTRLILALAPADAVEQLLAERFASAVWRLRRVQRYERECINAAIERVPERQKTKYEMLNLLDPKRGARAKVRQRFERTAAFLRDLPALDPAAPAQVEYLDVVLQVAGYPDARKVALNTVADVRGPLVAQAHAAGRQLDDFLRELAKTLDDHGATLEPTESELAAEREKMRLHRLLPDTSELDRIMRYEAHLHRLATHALHELDLRQARRRGENVPLGRIDLNVRNP